MSPALVLRLWRIAAVTVTAAVLLLLLLPGHRLPATSLTGLDTLAHVVSYGLIGLTWHRAGLPLRWVLGLGLAMAAGTELAQGTLTRGRQADAWDFVANAGGLILGMVASVVAGEGPRPPGDGTSNPLPGLQTREG